MAAFPASAKLFMSGLIERARRLKKTIAFPEGTAPRVLEAAARLPREGGANPVPAGPRPPDAPQGRSHGHNGLIAFADCAGVIAPNAIQMADIAIATAESTRVLINAEPVVALLSFSTKGSGKGPMVNKVVEAMEVLKARAPELN